MKSNVFGAGTAQGKLAGVSKTWWLGLALVVATVIAYWPVFSAGFIWDDDAYVTGNKMLSEPDGLWRIWFTAHAQSQYFPLVFTTLRLEYACWGVKPLGYHVVNVAVHVVNALLVWGLLRRLALPGAWLAAAVFALHPVQVETVAWVTELKNTESTMFYLLALFAWLEFCGGRGRWYYFMALGLQLLALFAKTTACTFPAVMLLALWLKQEPVNGRRIMQTSPFLLLGVGMGLLSIWWEGHLGNYASKLHLLGGPLDRCLIATRALWFYAGKIFWPTGLTFSYPRWQIDPGNVFQYVWSLACALTLGLGWRFRSRLGRGPVAAVVFFVAVLSPMLGFIPLYTFYFSYVADHYQYLACVGLIALTSGWMVTLVEGHPGWRQWRGVLAAGLLLVLGGLTWQQCGNYRDLESLWTDTIRKNPGSWMARTNLGRLLGQQGKMDEAEKHYLIALSINPEEESIHYNYGNLLARNHRLEAAIGEYQQAIRIAPAMAEAHNNLGIVLNKQHRTEEAITEYELAIRSQADFAEAYFNLGNALSAMHKMAAAVNAYQHAASLNPDSELFRKRLQSLAGALNQRQ